MKKLLSLVASTIALGACLSFGAAQAQDKAATPAAPAAAAPAAAAGGCESQGRRQERQGPGRRRQGQLDQEVREGSQGRRRSRLRRQGGRQERQGARRRRQEQLRQEVRSGRRQGLRPETAFLSHLCKTKPASCGLCYLSTPNRLL
ncbi:hypothetical protein [Variovorax sp. UC122_21]|uniref:hypothetical protein n=1 Tax=Variovorax sp. UC122_21 TaxID=3374554 RepID=UPI003757330A